MPGKLFFVISTGDGADMECLDEETLITRLNEQYWGDRDIWWDKSAFNVDLMAASGLWIIEGRPVKPVPVDVVKTFKLESR